MKLILQKSRKRAPKTKEQEERERYRAIVEGTIASFAASEKQEREERQAKARKWKEQEAEREARLKAAAQGSARVGSGKCFQDQKEGQERMNVLEAMQNALTFLKTRGYRDGRRHPR